MLLKTGGRFLKLLVPLLGRNDEDRSIGGSILESLYLWKLPGKDTKIGCL